MKIYVAELYVDCTVTSAVIDVKVDSENYYNQEVELIISDVVAEEIRAMFTEELAS